MLRAAKRLIRKLKAALKPHPLRHLPLVEAGEGYFEYPEKIQARGRVYIGPEAYWSAKGGIHIGDNVIFGPRTVIWSSNHNYRSNEYLPYGFPDKEDILSPVTLGDNVWVGLGATILAGVTVGAGAVVAAGAVVTKDVLPGEIVGGNPAKPIGQRDMEEYSRLKQEARLYLHAKAKSSAQAV